MNSFEWEIKDVSQGELQAKGGLGGGRHLFKDEIISFAAPWVGLEIVILSEINQRSRSVIWHPLYMN